MGNQCHFLSPQNTELSARRDLVSNTACGFTSYEKRKSAEELRCCVMRLDRVQSWTDKTHLLWWTVDGDRCGGGERQVKEEEEILEVL